MVNRLSASWQKWACKGVEACKGVDTQFSSFSTSPRAPQKAKMEPVHNKKGQILVYRYLLRPRSLVY